MGEAILSRSGSVNLDDLIVPLPDYHQIVATVLSSEGHPIPNISVNCKDGTKWYNYTSNEIGKVKFTTNSGAADISISNQFSNGVFIIDHARKNINLDAPLGGVTKLELKLDYVNNQLYTPGSGSYLFLETNKVTMELGAGGGGGGGAWFRQDGTTAHGSGGGGGGGAWAKYENIAINKNQIYSMFVGSGGSGGRSANRNGNVSGGGSSGQSTSFLNYSVLGGGGGSGSWRNNYTGFYAGGTGANNGYFGNGAGNGKFANQGMRTGFNSNISNWGGGGGVGGLTYEQGGMVFDRVQGGYPYGGGAGSSAINGGGGGGGWWHGHDGGSGGNGMVKLFMYK